MTTKTKKIVTVGTAETKTYVIKKKKSIIIVITKGKKSTAEIRDAAVREIGATAVFATYLETSVFR